MELKYKKTCFKLHFNSRKEAKHYIKKNIGNSKLTKPLLDVYFCEECQCWHTTSRPKEDREFFKKNPNATKKKQ